MLPAAVINIGKYLEYEFAASKLYGKNVLNFLQLITTKEGAINLNWDDDLVKGCCVTYNGEIVNERVKQLTLNN